MLLDQGFGQSLLRSAGQDIDTPRLHVRPAWSARGDVENARDQFARNRARLERAHASPARNGLLDILRALVQPARPTMCLPQTRTRSGAAGSDLACWPACRNAIERRCWALLRRCGGPEV